MNRRVWLLLTCAIVLVMTALLASSLGRLQFEPARPFGFASGSSKPFVLPPLVIPDDTPVLQILAFWLAIVLTISLTFLLLPAALRKRILRQFLSFAVGILVLYFLLRNKVIQWPQTLVEPSTGGSTINLPPGGNGEVQQFQPPHVAPWAMYVVSAILVWLLLLGLFLVYRRWQQYRGRRFKTMDELANIARTSLRDLAGGRQWGDVVLEAYARMNAAVAQSRGLQRGESATAREFATRLAQAGLPASAIDELTHLFESVRYGARASDESARRRATACLESILQACGAGT